MGVTPISRPFRVAMVSMHTSPADLPGVGDAGGLNVHVARTSQRLAQSGIEVDIFTRARSTKELGASQLGPGVTVHGVAAGPTAHVSKESLPGLVGPFAGELLQSGQSGRPYDVVHSHYWLSGQAAAVAARHWGAPLIHTMHTMGSVKNAALAQRDVPEPAHRIVAERDLVARADGLIANTFDDAANLIHDYEADPGKVHVVWPGVDLDVFTPGSTGESRAKVGLPLDGLVLLFVGRIQPLKAPDHLLRLAADLVDRAPELRTKLTVVICGGLSGDTGQGLTDLRGLANGLGISELVRFVPPTAAEDLAHWYRSADLTVVPSYSESFGLVALESQACGTPVVSSNVGGLRTAVGEGSGGVLVSGRDVATWRHEVERLLTDLPRRRRLSMAGIAHSRAFEWANTARDTAAVYRSAVDDRGLLVGAGPRLVGEFG